MRLLIEGLEKKDGYFEMPFEAFGILGEEREKVVIIGNDLDANFEIAKTCEKRRSEEKYIIYETEKNFPYNTLGAIFMLSCCSSKEKPSYYFSREDIDKYKILSTEFKIISDEKNIVLRNYIVAVYFQNEEDSVEILKIDGKNCEGEIFLVTPRGMEHSNKINIDIRNFENISVMSFLKLDQDFERVLGNV